MSQDRYDMREHPSVMTISKKITWVNHTMTRNNILFMNMKILKYHNFWCNFKAKNN